ncbi:Interleukin-17 receptor C, partial [Varanus komodoensis]
MYILTLALVLVYLPSACFQPATFPDSVNCSQGLGCRFLGRDVLCTPGEASPDPKLYPVLVLTQKTRNKLRCRQHQDCTPCVHVMLQLGLTGPPALGTSQELHGDTEELLQMHVFLSVQTHHSSNCLAVEIWLPHRHDWQTRNLGSLHFDCFPVAIGGELHFAAFTLPRYTSADVIRFTHHGPDCTWHKAKNAVRLCQGHSHESMLCYNNSESHLGQPDAPRSTCDLQLVAFLLNWNLKSGKMSMGRRSLMGAVELHELEMFTHFVACRKMAGNTFSPTTAKHYLELVNSAAKRKVLICCQEDNTVGVKQISWGDGSIIWGPAQKRPFSLLPAAEPPLQVAFGIRSRMLSTVLSCILVGRDIPSGIVVPSHGGYDILRAIISIFCLLCDPGKQCRRQLYTIS